MRQSASSYTGISIPNAVIVELAPVLFNYTGRYTDPTILKIIENDRDIQEFIKRFPFQKVVEALFTQDYDSARWPGVLWEYIEHTFFGTFGPIADSVESLSSYEFIATCLGADVDQYLQERLQQCGVSKSHYGDYNFHNWMAPSYTAAIFTHRDFDPKDLYTRGYAAWP